MTQAGTMLLILQEFKPPSPASNDLKNSPKSKMFAFIV